MKTEIQCLRIKLKEGKVDKVREWCHAFKEHKELPYVLEKETVIVETLFLDSQEDGDYLIFYLNAESLEKANNFLTTAEHPLNTLSNEFMQECWDMENIKVLEVILDLNRVATVGIP